MWSGAPEIAPGDLVIVWQTRDSVQPLVVTPGSDLNSRFGHYRHDDLVGLPYGSRVPARNGRGFVHVLRPTPELWTMALPHRTQILYLADIAFITSWLDIRRGSRVIEAGTGSGSFSHSIARTIGTPGHLYSYEFHEARADKARQEFVRHGMEHIVTLTHRNVCKDGFTVENLVDSVFLDLPAPWDAIEHAKNALRKDCPTRICCFSPCIEQVLRTVSALNDAGFTDITMYETLLRPHDVHQRPTPRPLDEVVEKLKRMALYREEKRKRQIARNIAGKRKREEEEESAGVCRDEDAEVESERDQPEELEVGDANAGMQAGTEKETEGAPEKRPRMMDSADSTSDQRSTAPPLTLAPPLPEDDANMDPISTTTGPSRTEFVSAKLNFAKACADVRGHTSYLTFARLVPFPVTSLPLDQAVQG